LKENFSRFNFALYKEKEMADFRRWFIALAVLALTAGLASAQVGLGGTTPAGTLICSAGAAAIPQLRAEGFTELVGDILISCTGGAMQTVGAQVPTTNITVYMAPNNNITSRLFSSSTGLSEVALLIDEPGSGLASGIAGGAATGAYGPRAAQTVCTVVGPTNGGCPTYVGVDPATGYEVAVTAPGGSVAGANVYQGYLLSGSVGNNSVTFYGVPVLPPVTTGLTRVFRITNIRFPAVGLSNQAPIQATVSTSPSTVLPLGAAGTGSSFPVGVVISPGLTTKVGTPTTFFQCNSQTTALSTTLSYTEGFPTAFKTRVVPLNNVLYGAEQTNTTSPFFQNIPGGLYGGFAANSESGYINSLDVPTSGSSGYIAGLADFGTRLKAVFTNIPTGVTLYVSTINTKGVAATAGTATLTQSTALLVATVQGSTGEAASDGTAFAPIASTVVATGGSGLPAIALTPNSSGVATAVWEVTNSQPATIDTLTFEVYISYTANPTAISSANPYGLPQPTTISPTTNNVSLSFAPEPGGGSFSAAAGPVAGTNIIPRFTILNPANFQWINITLCQTTLLYPFVTANPAGALGQGFDTGIAVANTSMDPFGPLLIPTSPAATTKNPAGTLAETGSCNLYPYGFTLTSSGGITAGPGALAVLKGCDTIPNPVVGTNCFPIVAPGSVQTVLASTVFPGFQGYVIAVCNFQYAHGYAAVTDLGLRGLFSSYLAIELSCYSGVGGACGWPGQARGVSIEYNSH